MRKETNKWSATSFGKPDVIRKSDESMRSAGRSFASDTRKWKKIGGDGMSPDAQAAVVTKPNLPMLPRGGTKSHPNLDVKAEAAPKTYGNSVMIPQDKSGDKSWSGAVSGQMSKSWKNKGYSKDAPSSLPAGSRLQRKYEI